MNARIGNVIAYYLLELSTQRLSRTICSMDTGHHLTAQLIVVGVIWIFAFGVINVMLKVLDRFIPIMMTKDEKRRRHPILGDRILVR